MSLRRTHTYHHPNRDETTILVEIWPSFHRDPLHMIQTMFHEYAHALAPCRLGVPAVVDHHHAMWINIYSLLIRELQRARIGPIMRELWHLLQEANLNWSSVLRCYSTGSL